MPVRFEGVTQDLSRVSSLTQGTTGPQRKGKRTVEGLLPLTGTIGDASGRLSSPDAHLLHYLFVPRGRQWPALSPESTSPSTVSPLGVETGLV